MTEHEMNEQLQRIKDEQYAAWFLYRAVNPDSIQYSEIPEQGTPTFTLNGEYLKTLFRDKYHELITNEYPDNSEELYELELEFENRLYKKLSETIPF